MRQALGLSRIVFSDDKAACTGCVGRQNGGNALNWVVPSIL